MLTALMHYPTVCMHPQTPGQPPITEMKLSVRVDESSLFLYWKSPDVAKVITTEYIVYSS